MYQNKYLTVISRVYYRNVIIIHYQEIYQHNFDINKLKDRSHIVIVVDEINFEVIPNKNFK